MANEKINIEYTANVTKALENLEKLEKKLEKIQSLLTNSNFSISVNGDGSSKSKGSAKTVSNNSKYKKTMQKSAPAYTDQEWAAKKRMQSYEDAKYAFSNMNPNMVSKEQMVKDAQSQLKYENAIADAERKAKEYAEQRAQAIKDAEKAFGSNDFKRQSRERERDLERETKARIIEENKARKTIEKAEAKSGGSSAIKKVSVDQTSAQAELLNEQLKTQAVAADYAGKSIQGLSEKAGFLGGAYSLVLGIGKKVADSLYGIAKGVWNFASKTLDGLVERIKQSVKGMKDLSRAFSRTVMYYAFFSAISVVTEGFSVGVENAYRWAQINNNQLAPSLDSIATSAMYLKNSIGAMAAPFINVLAPAIATVVDWVVTLINALNRLAAMLGGQGTWIKATKQAQNYKDAVGGASKALKSFTIGIDELNIIEDNAGGGGGAAEADYGGMFEEVALGASDIRDAIQNGEWTKVGELIAETINDSISNVDFSGVGQTIGTKIEHAFEVAYGFFSTINTEQIGSGIADFFNSLFDAINPETVGATIAEKWNRVIDFFYGFVASFKWADLGTSIGTGIDTALKTFDLNKLVNTAQTLIKGVLDLLINAVARIDWTSLGQKLVEALNQIDVYGLVNKAATFAFNLIDGIAKVVKELVYNFDWKQIGNDIINGISDVDENVIEDAWDIIFGLFSIKADLKWGLLTGVFKRIWADIKEDAILDWNAITATISIQWEQTKKNAEETWSQIHSKLSTFWQNIKTTAKTKFTEIKTEILNKWEEVKSETLMKWTLIKTTLMTSWENIKKDAETKFTNIKTTISTTWESVKSASTTIWSSIKTNLMSSWDNIKKDAESKFTNIKNTISTTWALIQATSLTVWNSIKTKFLEAWDGMKNGISERTTAILTHVETFINNMIDKINKGIEKMNELLSFDVGDFSFGLDIPTIDHVNIDGRATGGFMDSGQVYTVREGGIPEYVGRYGNRAAVANNEQIVDGIAGGVSVANEEVVAAINTLIGVVSGMDLSVNIGDKEIGQANERYTQGRGVYVNRGSFAGAY